MLASENQLANWTFAGSESTPVGVNEEFGTKLYVKNKDRVPSEAAATALALSHGSAAKRHRR